MTGRSDGMPSGESRSFSLPLLFDSGSLDWNDEKAWMTVLRSQKTCQQFCVICFEGQQSRYPWNTRPRFGLRRAALMVAAFWLAPLELVPLDQIAFRFAPRIKVA